MKHFFLKIKKFFIHRPVPVILLALGVFCVGLNFLYISLFIFLWHNKIEIVPPPPHPTLLFTTLEMGYLILGGMFLYLTISLWKLKDWSRIVLACLIGFLLPNMVMGIVADVILWQARWPYLILHISIFLLELGVIFYLLKQSTRTAFRKSEFILKHDDNWQNTVANNLVLDNKNENFIIIHHSDEKE
jgi:cbb3-type cytochrome oxidase subunit 3